MNSPEARPTPAPTMPGPIRRHSCLGGSGRSRIWGGGRTLVGSVGTNPPLRVGDLSITDISNVSFGAVPVPRAGTQAVAARHRWDDMEQAGRAGRFGTVKAEQDAVRL